MVEVGTKFVPVTVSVKPGPPAIVEFGVKDAAVGTGLLIAKAAVLDAPPSAVGPKTCTWAIPATVMSAALIAACT